MTIEQRLVGALRELDDFVPSPDLYARVERSLADDRKMRRRRFNIAVSALGGLAAVIAWVAMSAQPDASGRQTIDGWKLALAFITVGGAIVVALAPHLRRFGRSFIDEVFYLSPNTSDKFLAVLDIAYYAAFTGMVLVDADVWGLGERLVLSAGLEAVVGRIAFILLAMGLLHSVNLVALPVIGLIYNSLVRTDLRHRAGGNAPQLSMRALNADRAAHAFAIALAVIALSVLFTLVVGGQGAGILNSLG